MSQIFFSHRLKSQREVISRCKSAREANYSSRSDHIRDQFAKPTGNNSATWPVAQTILHQRHQPKIPMSVQDWLPVSTIFFTNKINNTIRSSLQSLAQPVNLSHYILDHRTTAASFRLGHCRWSLDRLFISSVLVSSHHHLTQATISVCLFQCFHSSLLTLPTYLSVKDVFLLHLRSRKYARCWRNPVWIKILILWSKSTIQFHFQIK